MSVRIDNVFCDDVRIENNGKFIIIGAYPSSINSNDLSAPFALTMWLRFNGLGKGSHESTLSVVFNGKEQHHLDGTLVDDGETTTHAVVHGLPMSFGAEGKIEVFVTVDGGEKIEAGSIVVKAAQNAV